MTTNLLTSKDYRQLCYWLLFLCLMVFIIVIIGGITRLTHSGLSMVDWKPLMGVIPPLSESDWLISFEKYKQFPEYQKLNFGMSLSEYKSIFFWEYFHRIFARLIGVFFLLPYLYFLIRKKIPHGFHFKFLLAFLLGGSQGVLGWYMVKSGLVNDPSVSHFRLAAHLCLAVVIFGYLFSLALRLWPQNTTTYQKVFFHKNKVLWLLKMIIGVLFLQITYGAFTAGLKAGFGYNTFPKMNNEWIPTTVFQLNPTWINFFSNGATVQFIHRSLGWCLLALILFYWGYVKKLEISKKHSTASNLLITIVALQFVLGVSTLLLVVPLHLAVIHQAGAIILFAATLYNHFVFKYYS